MEKTVIRVKTCPFGCKVRDLEVWDRGRTIKCKGCGILFLKGLEAWNKRKRGDCIEIEY
jgi:hypothetical protein